MLELINQLKDQKKKIDDLDSGLEKAFREYYRCVIRQEDRDIIKKLSKIPDNWDNYVDKCDFNISDNVKHRLSDVKKRTSWEVKMQSLYLASITSIEKALLDFFSSKRIDEHVIEDAINSLNSILLEIDSELINIKHLILSMAKRSISDCYYLLCSYCRYYLKKNFNYEDDIRSVISKIIVVFDSYSAFQIKVDKFITYDDKISSLFLNSSNRLGWRLNEVKTKLFFEEDNSAIIYLDLYKVAREAFEFKNELKEQFKFLKYYYNENDGREFRLKFIRDSMEVKLRENKIDENVFKKYNDIVDSFKKFKIQFEVLGLYGFGPNGLLYIELLQFLYKTCKIIEFYYLRNMQYDKLKEFRNEILFYVEKEVFSLTD